MSPNSSGLNTTLSTSRARVRPLSDRRSRCSPPPTPSRLIKCYKRRQLVLLDSLSWATVVSGQKNFGIFRGTAIRRKMPAASRSSSAQSFRRLAGC